MAATIQPTKDYRQNDKYQVKTGICREHDGPIAVGDSDDMGEVRRGLGGMVSGIG
jgi:hypothetical protein